MANFTFKKWWFAAGALVSCTLVLCTNAGTENKTASAYLNLADSVAYVGMQTCRSCHQNIYETFIHTGMGQSFDLATRDKSAATYGEHALVYDKKSDFYYRPYFRDSVLFIEEFRLENGDTVHKRTEQMAYIIGSGQHTNSHILNINGYIFQAPITFYTQKGRWDMAPGFGTGKNERFSRFL
ncbi:MAG TPA: pilus assembly protein TadD, partial [Saprospiraceae bacterium]|nr:pilus assembly protein TadD [Saprospiraceae bacterium]